MVKLLVSKITLHHWKTFREKNDEYHIVKTDQLNVQIFLEEFCFRKYFNFIITEPQMSASTVAGKPCYSREFLIRLKDSPLSMSRPDHLPHLSIMTCIRNSSLAPGVNFINILGTAFVLKA